ncbi:PAS domain S-box protein [Candidatus Thorarchaeota archaeon]|nr:MAG: PAS domain S-box protein [Candidatus Thorarchaeota archaeon]
MNSSEKGPIMGLNPLEFYKIVYDDLPQGVIVLKNDSIFYANKAFSKLIGYPINSIVDWPVEKLFDFLLTHQEELKNLYEIGGDPHLYGVIHDFQITTGDGEIKYVDMIPVMFSIHGEEYYHAMLIDASARVKAVQEMRESEERFRNTFDSIPDSAYLWERNDEGKIILKLANKKIVEMSGGAVNEMLGKEPNELFTDNPEFAEYIRFTMDSGQSISTETTFTHPQMPRMVNIIVHCVRPAENLVLMINTDITKEKKAQEIAKKSEQEKSIILDSMQDHLVYYESKDLKISWANKAAADSLNLTPSDLVGRYCYEIWQGRSDPCVDCTVLKAWKTGSPQETETKTPDNRIWLVKGLPVKNMAEQVISVVEVTREITAKKEAERITQDAKNRAELYLDLLSHDLNNIHQGIIIGLELALQNESIPEELREPLQTSLDQVNRGVNLIANIQKFSTIIDSPTHKVEISLVPIVAGAIELVRNSFPNRDLQVNLVVPDDDISIYADEFLMDAIFNLLHNSMKHGTNRIVTTDIKVEQDDDFVIIQIEDRGPGLDDDSKKSLLNRLESGIKAGSGIGLTLVKRIVERYNGRILIEDRVQGDYSQGVRFILYIPKK